MERVIEHFTKFNNVYIQFEAYIMQSNKSYSRQLFTLHMIHMILRCFQIIKTSKNYNYPQKTIKIMLFN